MNDTTANDSTTKLSVFLLAIRPKTLPASLSPVILGSSLAPSSIFSLWNFLLAAGCSLFLQIAVNLANDYFDAKAGIDSDKRLGPKRVTQSGLVSIGMMRAGIALFIGLGMACGLILVAITHHYLLWAGLACVIATLAYSGGPFPLASHGLGEIAVLVFFGWVAVMGSYYVQTLQLTWTVFAYANALGLILANIMLVNNIRDIETDRPAGKRTIAVRLGDSRSRYLYILILLAAALCHIAGSYLLTTATLGSHPTPSFWLLSLLPLALVTPSAGLACRRILALKAGELNPLLAQTAQLGLLYSVTNALTLYFT
ncbi:1,4-dihydroxy-2-naphthoate octaprenyltransferase [Teredinibacter waterburyi]|uniref:1,4-dihydroxy-2-naphthoate octaprenyltransferase n=1 Tax=Teredinibacter waterburyi TaxID=1500538 RepID=UPI00165F9DEF|nr:1,4-dihydroxy-2-naphthoate octaprenyltransferase [Teredinibacter waterburyi]